jgi:transcription antitermination factor NusG
MVVVSPTIAGRREWFALRTMPRHEFRVFERLQQCSVVSFLPQYKAIRSWKKRPPLLLTLPLFPTYLFVYAETNELRGLQRIPGSLGLVGSSTGPWPLESFQVEALRRGLHLRNPEPYLDSLIGLPVVIVRGPLMGLRGVLLSRGNQRRVVLKVYSVQGAIAVEANDDEIEAAP